MAITIEEFRDIGVFVKQHMLDMESQYNRNYIDHMIAQAKEDLEFRAWLKNHYPEALQGWNALNKIKES